MIRSPSTRLALAVAIVVLAGCGGGDDTTTSTSPAKSSKAAKPRHAAKLSPAAQRELNRQLREVHRLKRRLRGPDTPAERVQGAVKLVLTTTIPVICKPPFVTGRYLEAAYGGRQGCIDAQPARIAHKLEFKELRIDGDRATAVVVPSDGTYEGERLTVSLVRLDRKRWAVDELDADVPVGP
jgi:hypothetical protein